MSMHADQRRVVHGLAYLANRCQTVGSNNAPSRGRCPNGLVERGQLRVVDGVSACRMPRVYQRHQWRSVTLHLPV
ncbi:hypothetical protein FOA52_015118 [Chlamydomonas sp. UWO 241]|nr:hypothetical protein FOA52_015118 [Chlamydomonas sp. UWO 241]